MGKFEIGKRYCSRSRNAYPITVISRTAKRAIVRGILGVEWRMIISQFSDGSEIGECPGLPSKWRDAYTYSSDDVMED